MAYGGEWDLGLGVGDLVAGLGLGNASRKMGSLGREALALWVVGLRDSGGSWFGASVDPRGGGLDPLHQGQSPLRTLLLHSVVLVTVQQRDLLPV